jgi:hypothetical protein
MRHTDEVVGSWEEFEKLVSGPIGVARGPFPWYLFRGHAQAIGELTPTLTRLLLGYHRDASQAVTVENALLLEFKRLAHLYVDTSRMCPGDSRLEWSVVMQHYRAPTRLLDWTESAYAALYFAASQCPEEDGEVWTAPAAAVNRSFGSGADVTGEDERIENFFGSAADGQLHPELIFVRPPRWSDRMAAQGAWVSVASDLLAKHSDVLDRLALERDLLPHAGFSRIVIRRQAKHELLKKLRSLNISSRTLFPGIDGLGHSMRETAEIYCRDWLEDDLAADRGNGS